MVQYYQNASCCWVLGPLKYVTRIWMVTAPTHTKWKVQVQLKERRGSSSWNNPINQLDTVEMMSQSMVTNQRDISIEALSSQGLLQLQLMEHE